MEKILIADDEQLMRQLVIDFLKPEAMKSWKHRTAKKPWKSMTKNIRTSSSWTS